MKDLLLQSHSVFPTPHIKRTAEYYHNILGFRVVEYMECVEPHICLYRDRTEIILTVAKTERIFPNRELYGYGYDAYFITEEQEALQSEFEEKGTKIIKKVQKTEFHNTEFVLEDIDGRWIGFGIKERK